MKETLILRIPEELKNNLKAIAKDKGYTLNTIMLIILKEKL